MEELHPPISTPTNRQKSVTTPVSDEVTKNLNVNDDVEKWKKGAENFHRFTDAFERILLGGRFTDDEYKRELNREAIYHAVIPRDALVGLQVLFLQEKPVLRDVFNDESKVTRAQREETYQLLRNFGFEIVPDDK